MVQRPIDVAKYGVIYASSGKNLGPAGVAVVIVRRDLLGSRELAVCPSVRALPAQSGPFVPSDARAKGRPLLSALHTYRRSQLSAVPTCRRSQLLPCTHAAMPICRRYHLPPCPHAAAPTCRRYHLPPCPLKHLAPIPPFPL